MLTEREMLTEEEPTSGSPDRNAEAQPAFSTNMVLAVLGYRYLCDTQLLSTTK